MSKSKAQLSLVFISIVWGLSFLVLSDGVEFLAPETLLFWRFLTSAAVLFLIKKVTKNKKKLPWKEGLIAGVLFAVGYLSQTQGILYTSPSVAAFLTGLLVVFTPIIEGIVRRKAPRINVWISSFLALFGTYLLVNGGADAELIGVILQITCAVFFALHVVYIGSKPNVDPISFVTVQSLFVAAVCLVLAGFNGTLMLPGKGISAVLYLGILASALGLTVQVKAQKVIPPSEASIIFALEPVFATLFSALILSERITLPSFIGMILIFSATIIVDLNGKLRKRGEVKKAT